MNWYHKCSLDWMKARQKYLTATDVKDLLPVTKTGRSRTITEHDYFKVWARKQVYLTEADCESYGAMARGHLLEPYAIQMFNDETIYSSLFHWDDCVIHDDVLSFSPDALNIKQSINDEELSYISDYLKGVRLIGEVKSYGGEQHMLKGFSDREDLEERWQIATAMTVDPYIERGYLILFNPSCSWQMFVHIYERDDLQEEIEIISSIRDKWCELVSEFEGYFPPADDWIAGSCSREEEIYEEIQNNQQFNPGK